MKRAFTFIGARSNPIIMLAMLLVSVSTGSAQTDTGQIIGKVVDPNGALVANAAIIVKSVDTGSEVTATANDEGTYTVTNLKPGPL